MSSNIHIYSKTECPYCIMAKKLLIDKGYEYTETLLDDPEKFAKFREYYPSLKTVPQIFVEQSNGLYRVGGYSELVKMISNDVFDTVVNS